MMHELQVAIDAGALDRSTPIPATASFGWDTDQFPTNIYLTTQCMLCILRMGGLTTGGVNFDAKVRRESFEPVDLFHAHIGGMDAFARGLKIARAIWPTDGWPRSSRNDTGAGTASWAAVSKPARPNSKISRRTSFPRATRRRTRAAGKRCLRI